MILLMNVDKDNPSVAEGESVQIQGAGLTGFELKGNTHQDSYTGKNLLDTIVFKNRRINCYLVNDDGSITQSATDTNFWNNTYMPNSITLNSGTYTISVDNRNGATLQAYNLTTNSSIVERKIDSYTFTLNNDNQTINLKLYGASNYPFTFRIQIEQGSTVTSWEPFVGGIPSPNPDYPQPIEVVTGDNTIKVEGKNLYGAAIKTDNMTGSSYNIITDTSNKLEIQGVNNFYSGIYKKYQLKPNTQYTISLKYSEIGNNSKAQIFYKLGNNCENMTAFSNDGHIDIETTTTSLTFTTDSTGLVAIMFCCNWGANTGYIVYNDIQLEQGSATSYEPYQSQTYPLNLGSIELCKIPNTNYQDIIFHAINGDSFYDTLDNATKQTLTYGKWYKHSEIGKVVLDGSEEGWSYSPSGGITRLSSGAISKISNYIKGYSDSIRHIGRVVCTHFTGNTTDTIGNMYQYQKQVLFCTNSDITSVSSWKTWLSNNNVILYLVLETPTTTEITDTELIEQLEAISNIALFEGVNNISMESSNLTSSFKVYYDTWYEFDKILRNGYNIREDRDRITQKFANGHRKQFVSDYVDCSITLNLDTIDKDTTQDYLQRLKSGAYKYYSIDGKEYRTAQFIIENKPELSVESSISNNVDVNEYQITLLKAGD